MGRWEGVIGRSCVSMAASHRSQSCPAFPLRDRRGSAWAFLACLKALEGMEWHGRRPWGGFEVGVEVLERGMRGICSGLKPSYCERKGAFAWGIRASEWC